MSVNLLLSYAFHERTDLAKVRRNLVCGRLLIDSGAFTAFTKGKTISLDAYAAFLEKWRGCWDHAITLDVIGDPVRTAAQTRKLHERGLPVMPVFTKGGDLREFDAMVKDAGYVAVGGTVGLGTKPQRERVAMLQRRAADLGGGIHALGVGSLSSLRAARPYSADASSISGAFRFGTVVYYDGREVRNTPISNRARLMRDRDHLRAHGIDLALLARTGRMPGQMTGRKELMQAMSLAYAAADEVLKRSGPVPAPVRGSAAATHGTHLYNSIGGGGWGGASQAYLVADMDAKLHPGTHLYSSVAGGDTGAYAHAVARLDSELHADEGPHLYHACVGKNDNAEKVSEVDTQLHDGPHLYSSVGGGWLSDASMKVDAQVHSADLPHLWRVHGRDHHRWCRAAARKATA